MRKLFLFLLMAIGLAGCDFGHRERMRIHTLLVDDFQKISMDADRVLDKKNTDSAYYYLGKMDCNIEARKLILKR